MGALFTGAPIAFTATSSLPASAESLAVKRSTYIPGSLKLAMTMFARPGVNVTLPGPLTWLQAVVIVPPTGRPSSVTLVNTANGFGMVTDRSGPASTTGGSLAGVGLTVML